MDSEMNRIRRYTCERIKYYRRIHKLTQSEMAEKLWMSKRSYIRLEKGETAITLDRLIRIARIFKLSYVQLIGIKPDLYHDNLVSEFKNLKEQHKIHEKQLLELLQELKEKI